MSLQVFVVARLLPYEHDAGGGRSLTKHCLGRVSKERAATASFCSLAQRVQRDDRGQELDRAGFRSPRSVHYCHELYDGRELRVVRPAARKEPLFPRIWNRK